jgi:hypothetical protein
MLITDPRFLILILSLPGLGIPDSTTGKEKGEENFCLTFLVSHIFHKVENYFIFEQVQKIFANRQNILVLFTQILPLCSQKYGLSIRDPRSRIQNEGNSSQVFRNMATSTMAKK